MSHQPSVLNDAIARYSLFVWCVRAVTAAAAAGCLMLLFGSVIWAGVRSDPIVVPDVVSGAMMTNPRFTGRDDAQGEYVLRAESAIVRGDSVIDLIQPVLQDSGGRILTAEHGAYDRIQRVLILQGGVTFELPDPDGVSLSCASLRLDLRARQMTGTDITLAASAATVRADSFYSADDYRVVRVFGNVATLIAAAGKKG